MGRFPWRTICMSNADFAAANRRFHRMWDLGAIAFDKTRALAILRKMQAAERAQAAEQAKVKASA